MKNSFKPSQKAAITHVASYVTICLLVLTFAFSACCSNKVSPASSEPTKITYAMPITVAAIPSYVALEKGFWKEEGLEVQAQMFSAGRLALDALLANNAEVMSVSETPLMHAILQGNEFYIVTTVTEHQEVKAIARRDRGIHSPRDFRGKRIATLPGTNSDYFMYNFLEKNGVPVADIKLTSMAPPEMVTALVQGSLDAYFAWEPHIYYAQKQLPQQSIVFAAGGLYYGRHCIAMNKAFVLAHPGVVEKLIRGFLRAEAFANDNPGEAMAIVSKITGLDLEALNILWREYKVNVQLDPQLLKILNEEARWARSLANSSEPVPNFRDYIYSQALSKERPSSVNLGP